MGILDILGQPTDSIWGMINRLPSLFSQQEPPKRIDQPLKPTKEMTKNRLLDSIYNAEGKENARIPFGMFTQEFERRSATGEIIPYEEARAETSRHIDRHIKRWEAGGSRNILNAKARGLINANPEKNEAIIDGEWNPDFLKWYGEIYAPSHLSNTTLRPAEKEKNHNWLGNVRSGLNVPSPVPTPQQMQQQMAVPNKSYENAPQMYPPPKPQIPINKSHMYPPPKQQMQQQQQQMQMPKRRSLEEVTQTAQVQPALSPFPWLREVSGSYSHPSPPVGRWV